MSSTGPKTIKEALPKILAATVLVTSKFAETHIEQRYGPCRATAILKYVHETAHQVLHRLH